MCASRFRLFFLVLIFWSHESAGVYAQTDHIAAFTNVKLVPMTAETIIPDQTVLVKGSRIIAIGPSKHIDIPKDASIINGSHAYLVPGLADMHMYTKPNWLSSAWPVSPFYLYLAYGVTSIRDFGPKGRSPDNVLYWREGIKKENSSARQYTPVGNS